MDGQTEFVHVLDAGYQGLSGLAEHLPGTRPKGVRTETITVTTERLDAHCPPGWLPDFVKIDVEGAELQVLEGAVDTLRKAKPVVAFEHGLGSGTSEDLFNLLCRDVGLRLFNMEGIGPLDLPGFLGQLSDHWNWVAHD